MAPAVRVSLVDGNGNVITTARNSVTLALAANPSGGSFSAPQSVTAVSGVATFGNVVISEAGSGYSLVAKSTPLDSVSSAPFNVTNKALVTASGTANVSVIETATNEAVGSIAVGPQPSEDVAFTADGAFAYVPNQSAFVSVINVASGAIAATVPADAGTRGAAFGVTSNGPRVYVTNFASNNVTVINTSTNAVAGTIPVGPTPDRVAVTPDGSKAFVTLFGANMVSVIATGTNSVTTTIPVGAGPQGIAITPAGTLAYVANSNENSVSVIDVAANAVIGTVGVGNYPVGVAITPDGQFVYVAHQNSGFVAVISTTTNDIEAIVPLVAGIRNLAITPGGRFVYVPDGGQRVFVVSTATNAVVDTVSISPAGGALGIGIVPKP
jgi:YVTN family beta-propeller protein